MSLLAIKPDEQTRSVGDNVLARLDAMRQTHCLANKFAPTERARVAREAVEAGRRPWKAPESGAAAQPIVAVVTSENSYALRAEADLGCSSVSVGARLAREALEAGRRPWEAPESGAAAQPIVAVVTSENSYALRAETDLGGLSVSVGARLAREAFEAGRRRGEAPESGAAAHPSSPS
jgi:uncharacterized Fe-S cluster protein YjdI